MFPLVRPKGRIPIVYLQFLQDRKKWLFLTSWSQGRPLLLKSRNWCKRNKLSGPSNNTIIVLWLAKGRISATLREKYLPHYAAFDYPPVASLKGPISSQTSHWPWELGKKCITVAGWESLRLDFRHCIFGSSEVLWEAQKLQIQLHGFPQCSCSAPFAQMPKVVHQAESALMMGSEQGCWFETNPLFVFAYYRLFQFAEKFWFMQVVFLLEKCFLLHVLLMYSIIGTS